MSEQSIGKFSAQGGGNAVTMRSEVVEPLGEKIDVSCLTATGQRLIARVDARDGFPVGEPMKFHLDMEHVHVFEPGEFGRNITC